MRRATCSSLLLALAACNTAPVLPPEDDRLIELVETDLWSGGELRAVVRHAEAEEAPVAMTLDGEAMEVTRVDDTTFAAALPVHTGALPIRVEREDLGPLEATVTLHGYASGTLGPAVGGAVVAREVAGGHVVLGSTFEGAAEVSLANAQVLRTWPLSVHDVRCSGGIAPGPVAGHVIVRSGDGSTASDNCEWVSRSRAYDAAGLGASTAASPPAGTIGLSAILGPLTIFQSRQSQSGWILRCTTAGEPWDGCQVLAVNVYGDVVGYEAGYVANRIVPLARAAALHDLQTGDIVAQLPDDEGGQYYTAAAFSSSEDSMYAASNGHSGVYSGNTGRILALRSATGEILDAIDVPDGLPLALTVDDAGDWVLAVINHRDAGQLFLRVYSRTDHTLVAELPVDNATIVNAVEDHYHYRLILDRLRNQVTFVSTSRIRYFQNTPIPPMVIVRWSLP
jgi:hypothetical protein